MKIVINARYGMPRLKEGLEELGHEIVENLWRIGHFREQRIDAVIFDLRTIFNRKWRFPLLAWQLQKLGIPVVMWNVDAPWHMNRAKIRVDILLKSRLLDIYATHSLQDTDWIKGTRVLYLPNAAWVSVYNLNGRTIDELRDKRDYRYDVSFIGNLNGRDHPEHRRRVEFLARLGEFLQKSNINYRFADATRDKLGSGDQIDIIQNSRINLSCLAAADSKGVMSWGLTERAYGVPACGGFLLMEKRVHIKDDFDEWNEVATYDGLEECQEKILYYLGHDEERRHIMATAHDRVMREHTYRHRAEALVREIEKFL